MPTRPVLLVLRALGLGDLLTAVPALRGLRRAFVGHELVLATPRWLGPLVGLVDVVDRHLPVGELEPLPATLTDRVDVAVNLHGSGPQSARLLLARRPGRLVTFAHPQVPDAAGGPVWRDDEHEVVRWCRLVEAAGADADPTELDLRAPTPTGPVAAAARGATVVHPGAKSGARRWPAGRFAAIAARERRRGRRVVVTGSAGERALALEVAGAAGLPETDVLAGRLDLAELAGVVAAAGRVVCGDTGVAHLATAMGTASVVLFGPTPPTTWGPPVERADRHRVLWAGRRGDPLADEPFAGLLALSVDDVARELDALDAETVAGTR